MKGEQHRRFPSTTMLPSSETVQARLSSTLKKIGTHASVELIGLITTPHLSELTAVGEAAPGEGRAGPGQFSGGAQAAQCAKWCRRWAGLSRAISTVAGTSQDPSGAAPSSGGRTQVLPKPNQASQQRGLGPCVGLPSGTIFCGGERRRWLLPLEGCQFQLPTVPEGRSWPISGRPAQEPHPK
jgi:hypothetical protein